MSDGQDPTTFTEVSLRYDLLNSCTGKEPTKDGLCEGDIWLKDMENFWYWSSLANKWYPLCINGKKIQYPDIEISLIGEIEGLKEVIVDND